MGNQDVVFINFMQEGRALTADGFHRSANLKSIAKTGRMVITDIGIDDHKAPSVVMRLRKIEILLLDRPAGFFQKFQISIKTVSYETPGSGSYQGRILPLISSRTGWY